MRAAVVVYPGSNCDRDLARAFRQAGAEAVMVWHKDTALPDGIDVVGDDLGGISAAPRGLFDREVDAAESLHRFDDLADRMARSVATV